MQNARSITTTPLSAAVRTAVGGAALALALAGCASSPEEDPAGSGEEQTAGESTGEESAGDPAADGEQTEGAEPESTLSEGGADGISVEATGNGPVALTTTDDPGEGEEYSGRLITASGNCFSVNDNDRPQLVVFPADADFTLTGDRPSVELPGGDTLNVGEQVSFEAAEVALSDIDGIPDRCAQGADDTVQVVLG